MFHPQNCIRMHGRFVFEGEITARANACFDKNIFREFWHGFSCRSASLKIEQTDELIFQIGTATRPELNGYAYAINVEPNGLCIAADTKNDLILGFMTLIDRMEAIDVEDHTALAIACCQIHESPAIQTRMAHFCVFPETELWEIQKFIRFCGALRYSHVILEFWGMFRYDCMKELAWEHGYTKEELRPLIQEAVDMGMEIVPMFNHWGHAPCSRGMHGKHVVLDQNPALSTYFCADGWCWDIQKPKVRALMKNIRKELCELCGGSYFHVGCDEAAGFAIDTESGMDIVCNYLNEIAEDMAAQGRRIIAWGDMFLYRHAHYNPHNIYTANAPCVHTEEYMLQKLDKRIIMADWQYDVKEAPVETSAVFTKAGFDCMICPWDRSAASVAACLNTVKESKLAGLIHTTWHTLSAGTVYVAASAVGCFEDVPVVDHFASAATLRKAWFAGGDYRKAGWAKYQISVYTG